MKKKTLIFMLGILTILLLCLSGCGKMFTLCYEAGEGGSLKGTAEQSVQAGENGEEIIAVESEGYQFKKWSDGVTGARRKDTNVQSDISVTAEFTKRSYTVRYEADRNGTLEGNAEQSIQYGEDGESVTAIPREGYEFLRWSDGVETATRQEKDVRSDFGVTALFTKKTLSVRYEAGEGGYIEGNAEQNIQFGEDGKGVTAIPREGYQFEKWSDGVMEATRQEKDVSLNIFLKAEFRKKEFTVHYNAVGGGYFTYKNEGIYHYHSEESVQKIKYGETSNVIAENSGSHFLYWSDGSRSPERNDIVTEDIEFTAYFGFSLEYKVFGDGGKIIGQTYQEIVKGQDGESVEAFPDEGYVFAGWSEVRMGTESKLNCVHKLREVNRDFFCAAYFERIKKIFDYDYGRNFSAPAKRSVAIQRETYSQTKFIIPDMKGYVFCGWYADENYEQKVVNEEGKLMLGYYTFDLDTDTLYAKWEKEGEESQLPEYKILMPMISELHVSLASSWHPSNGNGVSIDDYDYIMGGFERKYLYANSKKFTDTLKSWFERRAIIEVDLYFTCEPLGSEENRLREGDLIIDSGATYNEGGMNLEYYLNAENIPELGSLNGKYHSVITSFSFDEYDSKICSGGASREKYAMIDLDSTLFASPSVSMQEQFETMLHDEQDLIDGAHGIGLVLTYLHELTHTIEMQFDRTEIYEFHRAHLQMSQKISAGEIIRRYLLHELKIDGQLVGIPNEFWQHKFDVHVSYVGEPIDGRSVGKIIVVGEVDERPPSFQTYIARQVPYGSTLTVEAIPYQGYEFVKWSDGVMTAQRTDENIISFLSVTAIYTKNLE